MSWSFIEDPRKESSAVEKPNGGWSFIEDPTKQSDEVEQPQEKKDSGFLSPVDLSGFMRTPDIVASSALGAGLDTVAQMLGGGKGSQQDLADVQASQEYEMVEKHLKNQGYSDKYIQSQLGKRPKQPATSILEGLQDVSGLKPKTPAEEKASEVGKTIGEFLALGASMPGGMTASNLAKEAKYGAAFGTGAEIAGGENGDDEDGGENGDDEDGGFRFDKLAGGTAGIVLTALASGGPGALGKAVSWAKSFFEPKKAKEVAKAAESSVKFLEESGTPKALADLELSQKDLVGRVAKTSDDMVEKFTNLSENISPKSTMSDISFSGSEIENTIVRENRNEVLNRISDEAESRKEGWEYINSKIEENFKAAKETYKSMYKSVKEESKKIKMIPQSTMDFARKQKKELSGSLLSVTGESSVKGTINNLIQKLIPKQEGLARKLVSDLKEAGVYSNFEEVLNQLQTIARKEGTAKAVSLDSLIQTKRSLNRLLSKAGIISAPIDLLKPLGASLKEDILEGLKQIPNTRRLFIEAEELFGKTQDVFNNDIILKSRKTTNPEDLSAFFSKPSNLEKLNESLGHEPNSKQFADRMIIDYITSKSEKAATELAKELFPYLSPRAREATNMLIDSGSKLSSSGQASLARGKLFSDIQKSVSTGSRPDYALKLMQNKTGRSLVNNTLNRSPNGRKILKELHKMSMQDLMSSVMKDGVIDFNKAEDILSNPDIRGLVKDAVDVEGLQFFERLQFYGKNMAENLAHLSKNKPGFAESLFEKYLTKEVTGALVAISGFTGLKSLIPIVVKEGIIKAKKLRLEKILTSKPEREAIKLLGKKGLSIKDTESALKEFHKSFYIE